MIYIPVSVLSAAGPISLTLPAQCRLGEADVKMAFSLHHTSISENSQPRAWHKFPGQFHGGVILHQAPLSLTPHELLAISNWVPVQTYGWMHKGDLLFPAECVSVQRYY